ncbi:unnamed protein product [Cuscuta epithymum]|uniref:Uncharacterized protein n=1 Tax=Cuscuta epithymum TaxID=186058 RepID=A0AAV0D5W0_9ASTE|nr:unnamed protein product [Cuscuta epithymum]
MPLVVELGDAGQEDVGIFKAAHEELRDEVPAQGEEDTHLDGHADTNMVVGEHGLFTDVNF